MTCSIQLNDLQECRTELPSTQKGNVGHDPCTQKMVCQFTGLTIFHLYRP